MIGNPVGTREPVLGLSAHRGRTEGARGHRLGDQHQEDLARAPARSGGHETRSIVAVVPPCSSPQSDRRRLFQRRYRLAPAVVCALLHRSREPPRHLAGCTAHPDGEWVTQHARQVAWALAERDTPVSFLIRDHDGKFTNSFDAVFEAQGTRIIARHSGAGGQWDRGTVRPNGRTECLDWLLILNTRHLERTLTVFVDHYNGHRPHRSLDLVPPWSTGDWKVDRLAHAGDQASRPSRRAVARLWARGLTRIEFTHRTGRVVEGARLESDRADAQPRKRVAVVAAFRATGRRGARCGSSRPAARGRPPRIDRSRGSRSSADAGPATRAAARAPSMAHTLTGIDVIGPLEAFNGFRDRLGAPPEIPDAPAHDEVDDSCRASR